MRPGDTPMCVANAPFDISILGLLYAPAKLDFRLYKPGQTGECSRRELPAAKVKSQEDPKASRVASTQLRSLQTSACLLGDLGVEVPLPVGREHARSLGKRCLAEPVANAIARPPHEDDHGPDPAALPLVDAARQP